MKILPNGVAVPDNDLWHGVWCSSNEGLNHDGGFMSGNCIKHAQPGERVVCAGGHIGTICVPLAAHGANVWAFEPHPDSFECLSYNMKPYADTGYVLTRMGLWSSKSHGALVIQRNHAGVTQITVGSGDDVQLTTIDSLGLNGKTDPRLALIQLDCEGAELQAILGAEKTIAKHRPALVVEVNRHTLTTQGDSAEALLRHIESLGYRWSILQPECNPESEQFDIEAVPV